MVYTVEIIADPNHDSMAATASAAKDNEHNCDALKENLKENVKENLKIGYQLIRVMMVVTITAVVTYFFTCSSNHKGKFRNISKYINIDIYMFVYIYNTNII